jgi:hypothetical protein
MQACLLTPSLWFWRSKTVDTISSGCRIVVFRSFFEHADVGQLLPASV